MEAFQSAGELKIGVDSLDAEHQEMTEAIDALRHAVLSHAPTAVVGPLLRQVAQVTQAHFEGEEAMMQATRYPGLNLHLMRHQHLSEQLNALVARYDRGGFLLNEHSIKFLHDWLRIHIQKDDQQYALWINEHGKR